MLHRENLKIRAFYCNAGHRKRAGSPELTDVYWGLLGLEEAKVSLAIRKAKQ